MPENIDEFIARMEEGDFDDAELATFNDYARRRNMRPQLLYYYRKSNKQFREDVVTRCNCGRQVVNIEAADAFFKEIRERRGLLSPGATEEATEEDS